MKNKLLKNMFLHIKYPYTALVISVMWISMAIIITKQERSNFEFLIIATAMCTLVIALRGFSTPK